MKKTFKFFAAAMMLISASGAMAADFTYDGIAYNIISLGRQTCEVTGKGGSLYYSGNIVIPEKVVDSYDNTEYTVIAIGKDAFNFCQDLQSVTLPNTIKEIKKSAFGSSSLPTLVIPSSCTVLGESVFWGAAIENISIPGSIRKVGDHCFRMCRQLTEITMEEGVDSIGNYALYGCETLTKVNMPASLTTIGEISFGSCDALQNIEMPAGLKNVGKGMFVGCKNLKSIGVNPASQTLAAVDGILYSKDLSTLYEYPWGKPGESFEVPAGTKKIWANAFQKNPNLKTIRLAQDTEVVGDYCFNEIANLESIDFGASLKHLGSYALMNLPLVKDFKFPESLERIDQMAVSKNTGLTKIVIPNNVESIGDYAFFGCEKVTEIYIGSGLKELEKVVFQRTYGVKDVYCYAEVPPTCNGLQFQSDNYKSATLHVPAASLADYKSAAGWMEFTTIDDKIPTSGVETIASAKAGFSVKNGCVSVASDDEVSIYSINGVRVWNGKNGNVNLPRGIYTINSANQVSKIAL